MRLPGLQFLQLLAAAGLAATACTGQVGVVESAHQDGQGGSGDNRNGGAGQTGGAAVGGAGNGGGGFDSSFTCDETLTRKSPAWRRLTRPEYENTVRDLLNLALGDATLGGSAFDEVKATWANLPTEIRQKIDLDIHGTTRRLDQAVAQEHANAWYLAAIGIGKSLTTTARIGKLLGACATDANAGNDVQCLNDFINRFGERVLRRPLAATDTQFYAGFYGTALGVDPAGVADVVGGLFAAPEFLYHIVNGAEATTRANEFALTPYELAARLSYHFWATMPDEELWSAAKSGALQNADMLASQVSRLVLDARARPSLREFYRDWLKLDDQKIIDPAKATEQFRTFAGGDMPKGDLRTGIIDDTLDLLSYYTWDKPAALSAALTSNLSFARSPDLARIYGLAAWSGTGDPPAFADGQRPGLLTRAAFLVTGTALTRPIVKGVFVRQNILCDNIPAPPADATNVDTTPFQGMVMSTRQLVEAVTQNEGTVCNSCHSALINGLGFATEGFDALGRARTDERVLSDTGTELGIVPINTRSFPRILPDDEREVAGPGELAAALVESGRPDACVARQYFRFAFTRAEDVDADGCVLERLRTALAGGNLSDLLKEAALTPEFGRRLFQ